MGKMVTQAGFQKIIECVQSIEFNCWELFGQLFRLPLPIFLFRFALQKGFPLKSGCE